MAITKKLINLITLGLFILISMPTFATEENDSIADCLKAWGEHPFGNSPSYKTLATSVTVFGIGEESKDLGVTNSPSLVLVNSGVNVMGGTTMLLLNPNGWYCLRSNVNVMGGLTIKVHCKAHLASATESATVLGINPDNKSITVMGSTEVEPVGCD